VQSVALVFQPAVDAARRLAERCASVVEAKGLSPIFVSAWDLTPSVDRSGVRLAVTYGGDGTIIRAARWLAGTGIPILGVAMGKLGFMTELRPDAACEGLEAVLDGGFWIDERLMLRARIDETAAAGASAENPAGQARPAETDPLLALNEIVVTRGDSVRVLQVDVAIDDIPLVQYVADGVIVATPTGSTAYSLAAGGPIVAPGIEGLLITPVAAHLAVLRSIVVPASSRIELRAHSDQPAVLALDGQRQIVLRGDQRVWVEVAPERTLFARTGRSSRFYETLVPSLKKR
jgi:NAD+ kinase